jgi:hypothetical protein
MAENKPDAKPSEFYESYAAFARTLRTWFVAFGVGVPALLVANEKARELLVASGCARRVACILLAGVVVQVASTLLYKLTMLYLYLSEDNDARKNRWCYRFFDSVSEAFWLECGLDLVTLVLFSWATVEILCLFTAAGTP